MVNSWTPLLPPPSLSPSSNNVFVRNCGASCILVIFHMHFVKRAKPRDGTRGSRGREGEARPSSLWHFIPSPARQKGTGRDEQLISCSSNIWRLENFLPPHKYFPQITSRFLRLPTNVFLVPYPSLCKVKKKKKTKNTSSNRISRVVKAGRRNRESSEFRDI